MEEVENRLVKVSSESELQRVVPRLVAECGAAAHFAWEELFLGRIRNIHTRMAYLRSVRRFLGWCEQRELDLPQITPGWVGRYFDELAVAIPSKKLHLAAIRAFFDVLVQRHVVVLNPALCVRTERYSALEGKTPEISVEQCRKLLASIEPDSTVNLRDRAIIGVLIFTAARAGAVAKLRLKDFAEEGTQFVLRFMEKGGKARSIPVRSDLQGFIQEYMRTCIAEDESKDAPLFRTAAGKSRKAKPAIHDRRRHLPPCKASTSRGQAIHGDLPAFLSLMHGDRSPSARRCLGRRAISSGSQ